MLVWDVFAAEEDIEKYLPSHECLQIAQNEKLALLHSWKLYIVFSLLNSEGWNVHEFFSPSEK